MFNLFKPNPTKKLRKELAQLQEKSMQAQRKGDIRTSSELASEADTLWQKIQEMEQQS
ncbi:MULTISPECIES: DUF6435 family protein [Gammaproteobacteria]|uniref:DUF6435 family protein n=1 Tax=Gammaproteobacteria TaxID=1236 RepID=UPI000DD07BAF|nr:MULTISPECIES: DUF6435 family protein [Gammaproteobacteria]RTE87583.1 Lacal_2735 family protein [Aliidiomarina sp. B3213]TCZ92633.1 Lacal_2735 family protein [Lysobacter sp. N42]